MTPVAQAQTFERWVSDTIGDDDNNCTRTVESPNDDNDLEEDEYTTLACKTLARALEVANSGDIIYVEGGNYAGGLTINKEITIIGGFPLFNYDGDSDFERVPSPTSSPETEHTNVNSGGLPAITIQNFPISGTAPMQVTLDGLRLSGTNGAGGGALRIEDVFGYGDVSLVDMRLQGNAQVGNGGGLYVNGTSFLGRTQVSMEGGAIVSSGAANGGGLYASGAVDVELLDVQTEGNSATGSGGGIYMTGAADVTYNGGLVHNNGAGGDGGGIYVTGGVTATIGGLTMTQNSAARGGALAVNNAAPLVSGLYIAQNSATSLGGGVYVEGSTFTLAGSTFLTNTVSSGHGGGLAVDARSNSLFTLASSNFAGNQASGGDGGGIYATRSGGTQGRFVIDGGVELALNSAQRGGGVYMQTLRANLAGTDFISNTATSQGGGLFVAAVAGNTSVTGSNFTGNSAPSGGGLYGTGNFALTGPNFIGNLATGGSGNGAGIYLTGNAVGVTGGIFFQENAASGAGGGAYLTNNAVLTAASLDALDNSAPNGGGVYVTSNARLVVSGAALLQRNEATTGSGGGLYITASPNVVQTVGGDFAALSNTAAQQGGALYVNNGQVQLNSGSVSSNEATANAGGGFYLTSSTLTTGGPFTFSDNEAGTQGGALATNQATLNLQAAAQMADNRALTRGGALALIASSGSPGVATLGGAPEFRNNLAGQGGAIYTEYVTLDLGAGALFQENGAQDTSTSHGGAIYSVGAAQSVDSVTFDRNNAFVNGGALYIQGAGFSAGADARFVGNFTLTGQGGALYFTQGGSQATVNGASFEENRAATDGGAIYVAAGNLAINADSEFRANQAENGAGGAIYTQATGATLALTGATLDENQAAGAGGGIYAHVTTLSLADTTLAGNRSDAEGGGIYAQAASATVQNSTLNDNWAQDGGGAYLLGPGQAQWTGNTVRANQAGNHGGGLYLLGMTLGVSTGDLVQNMAQSEGGGVYALYSRAGFTNTVAAQNSLTDTVGVGGGVWARNAEVSFFHSTLADHSHLNELGSTAAIYLESPQDGTGEGGFSTPTAGSVRVENSIVADNQIGLYLLAGNQATLTHSLWQNSRFDWNGDGEYVTVTANRRGDPRFFNAGQGDYRIRRASAAFDLAAASNLASDKIGVSRNQGFAPDAGAFEHRYARGLYLDAQVSPPFVRSGESVVYTIRVRNSSSQRVDNVRLNSTLPNTQPSATINGQACQIFCNVNLGNLAAGETREVTISASVQGTPPATGLGNMNANLILQADNFGPADSYGDSDKSAAARSYLFACSVRLDGVSYPSVQDAVNAAPGDGSGVVQVAGYCGDIHTDDGPGQAVTLDKDITLQGGWNSDFSARNPATTPSAIDAGGLGRVVYVTPGVAVTLEDIGLRGGATNGLGGGLWGKDAGGGLYAVDAALTLRGVDIANSRSDDLGGGMYVAGDEPVRLEASALRQNEAGDRGGGIFIAENDAELLDPNVSGNRARAGGGIYVYHSAPTISAEVAGPTDAPNCRVDANVASGSPLWRAPLGASTFWLSPGGGGGIFLDNAPASIVRCSVQSNQARSGGGVYMHRRAATLQQSVLSGNTATGPVISTDGEGGALYVLVENPGDLALGSNFYGLGDAPRGSGLFVHLLNGSEFTLRQSTIAHNLGGSSLYATGPTNLNVVDSIIAFNAGTAVLAAETGGSGADISLNRTLWHQNGTDTGSEGQGAVTRENNFSGDPAFFNDGFRIKRISAAYGRGGSGAILPDRDGDTRPQGEQRDLGADEYATAQFVRYVAVATGNDANTPCADYLNPCRTLQAAIDAAGAGDLIKLAGGEYTGLVARNGHNQIAYLDKNVSIQGGYYARTDSNGVTDGTYTLHDWELSHAAENPTILDAASQGRVLTILSPEGQTIAPRIAFVELARGLVADVGGGVLIQSANPRFEQVLVRESRAAQGGGLYLRNSGGELAQITVRGNEAQGEGNTAGQGGGIYIEGGAPTLRSLTIEANSAISGAGVYVGTGSPVLVQNTVRNNGGTGAEAGGGIFLMADAGQVLSNTVTGNLADTGAGLYVLESQASVQGNTVAENIAGQQGGGLYIAGGAPNLTGNLVRANQAAPQAAGLGGGLYLAETAAQLRQNEVAENLASAGGGLYLADVASAVFEANLVRANRAETGDIALGGGLYLNGGTLTLTGNTVRDNLATRGAGVALVCAAPTCTDVNAARPHLIQNQVLENRAAQHGGGFYVVQSAPVLAQNSILGNQTQQGNGAGLYMTQSRAELTDNTVQENLAGLNGGGLYLAQDAGTLTGGVIGANRANSGGGIYFQNQPAAGGAALLVPRVVAVEIVGNRAAGNGGGIYAQQSRARLEELHIHQNQAVVDGGGVYLEESVLRSFAGNLIAQNQAGGRGGGLVLFRRSNSQLASNALIDNTADSDGGGIAILGSSPTLAHTTLARNAPNGVILDVANNVSGLGTFYNSIIAGHDMGVRTYGSMQATLDTTLFSGNQADTTGPVNSIVTTNNVEGAPGFTADGFRLQAGSAAQDAGRSLDGVSGVSESDDIDGQARVQGGGPDLGAHELTAPCFAVRASDLSTVYDTVQAAIDASGPGGQIRIAGTCSGLSARAGLTQLAYIDKNLTLRGGYLAGAWNSDPDPDQYPTVLDARAPGLTGRAIYVAPNSLVVLENLTLYYGDATGQGGGPDLGSGPTDAGGNLYVGGVSSITVNRVDFRRGQAAIGGGLYVQANSGAITEGSFVGNQASLQGGGFYLDGGSADLAVRNYTLRDNTAAVGGGGAVNGGQPTVANNRFERNQAAASSLQDGGRGGGLFAFQSQGTLINNQYYENQARLGGALCAVGSAPAIYNNMAGRNAAEDGSAFYVEDAPVNLRHNTLVDNTSATGSAETAAVVVLGATTSVDFEFTNNIVVGHGTGLNVAGNSSGFARANIWFENQTRWTGTISEGQGNQDVAPVLRDRGGGDYFLTETSPAVDQGLNAGVSIDIENRPRPGRLGYDMGAHEFLVANLTASLFAVPNPVGSGQSVGLVAQVINNGDVDLVADIVLTLPVGLSSEEQLVYPGVELSRGATWSQNIAAEVGDDVTGSLNAQIAVTSDLDVSANATTSIVATDATADILAISLEATPSPVPAGSEIQYRLRVDNSGGVALDTNIQVDVPDALDVPGPLAWNPVIAGAGGAWTTTFTGTVAADAPDTLPVDVRVLSTQGPGAQRTVITELARPALDAAIVAEPAPVENGGQLTYRLHVTNTGNVPLSLQITPTLAAQVVALDLSQDTPTQVLLAPRGTDLRAIPVSVEPGYVGPLVTRLLAVASQGVQADARAETQAVAPAFEPSKTANGGNWHDPAAWTPAGVPGGEDVVLIPEAVVMIAERPIEILALRNLGELILRGTSAGGVQVQQLQIARLLENFGLIRGADGRVAGAPGTTLSIELDVQAGALVNEGEIRAGNGASDGGAGGAIRLAAGSIVNNGEIFGGRGADVVNPGAGVPGGTGGGIFVTVEPGQLVNRGRLVAGNGGAAHPDADPPQAGGVGGDITILGTSLLRLDDSELRAGAGGAGSQSDLGGRVGIIGIGAVRVSRVDTDFSRGALSIVESGDAGFGFTVLGPSLVLGRIGGGEAIITLRIFNRSARQETYVITPLRAPAGWQFVGLPRSVNVPAFRSLAVGIRLRPPTGSGAEIDSAETDSAEIDSAEVGGIQISELTEVDAVRVAAALGLRAEVRVTAQRNAGLRNDVPVGIVASFGSGATLLHLPQVSGGAPAPDTTAEQGAESVANTSHPAPDQAHAHQLFAPAVWD